MAIFEKGSSGDIAVYEAFLCMFPEGEKKKGKFPLYPTPPPSLLQKNRDSPVFSVSSMSCAAYFALNKDGSQVVACSVD